MASLWIVGVRLWTAREPLDRDAATYAVVGREMLAGRVLYRDLFDHKPPGAHVALMAAQAIGGSSEETVAGVGILVALATMVGVFLITRSAVGSASAGAASALFWAMTSATLGLQANQLNTEAFVNLFLVSAIAVLVRWRPYAVAFLGAGFLLGVASLFKTVVIVPALGLGLAAVLGGRVCLRRRAAWTGLMAAGALAPWVLTIAVFAALGALGDMVFAVFTYNKLYAGQMMTNIAYGFAPGLLAPRFLLPLLPIAALALLLFARSPRLVTHLDLLLIAWLVSVPVVVALPGRFAPHYYQFWLPVLPVCAVVALWRLSARPVRLAAGVTLALLGLQAPTLALSSEECSLRKYGPVFLEARELGREIRRKLGTGAAIWHWGAETSLYFYTEAAPPTRFFYNYPLDLIPERFTDEVTREVATADPVLVVVYRRELLPMPPALSSWLHRGYSRVAGNEGWDLFERRVRAP